MLAKLPQALNAALSNTPETNEQASNKISVLAVSASSLKRGSFLPSCGRSRVSSESTTRVTDDRPEITGISSIFGFERRGEKSFSPEGLLLLCCNVMFESNLTDCCDETCVSFLRGESDSDSVFFAIGRWY